MRDLKELDDAYRLLEDVLTDEPYLNRIIPGPSAREFAWGAAAALWWSMGHDVRPLRELLAYLRKNSARFNN